MFDLEKVISCFKAIRKMRLILLKVILFGIYTFRADAQPNTLKCSYCVSAANISDCTIVGCNNATQDCFTEQLVTDRQTTVYNAGCQYKNWCVATLGSPRKKRDTLTACAKCCSDVDHCNSQLCGLKPAVAQSNAVRCRYCDNADRFSDCTMVNCDNSTEECFTEEVVTNQLTIAYHAGCRNRSWCQEVRANSRQKKDLTACTRCCSDVDDCNSDLCGLKQAQTKTLRCRYCNNAANVSDCTMVDCNINTQECFTDEKVTDRLTIAYDAGCRDKDWCQATRGNPRQKKDLLACTRCCSDVDGCNSDLCGLKQARAQTQQRPSNTVKCRICRHASSLSNCTETAECVKDTEMCYMEELITGTLDVVYQGGCRSKEVCTASTSSMFGKKKREDTLVACSRCCYIKDYCNEQLCGIK